ncbi:MAG: OmpA family protein [Bacteroidota bacterium]
MRSYFFFLLLVFALGIQQTAQAQTSENRWMAELSAVFLDYQGLYNGDYFQYKSFDPGITFAAHTYLGKALNLSLSSSFVPETDWLTEEQTFLSTSLIDVNTMVRLKSNGTILREDALFAPYIGTGFGLNSASNNLRFYVPATVGVQVQVSQYFSLHFAGTYKQRVAQNKFQHMSYTAGFVFALPSEQRPVKEDEPFTPIEDKPVVQNRPQLADRDKDGVPDRDDLCPDVKGKAMYLGCPEDDKPATPAPSKPSYATTPSQNQNPISPPQPDPAPSDDYQIQDETLNAPTNIDILNDYDNNIIPPVSDADNEYIAMAMNSIYFEPSSDELTLASLHVLDTVAMILDRNPQYNLQVIGHTDAVGDQQNNVVLSIRRAFRVKYYLVNQKNIKMYRISSDGKADATPISSNQTAQGRARNRRVEFKLIPNKRNSSSLYRN